MLLQNMMQLQMVTDASSATSATDTWTATLCYSDGDVIKQVAIPGSNPTVGEIRVAVAKRIGFTPNKVRVILMLSASSNIITS